jgi:hypothetical protein
MTKIRTPLGEHDAVAQAIGLLGIDLCRQVTGKSESLIRKWADPDEDAHHIPFAQALRLDAALVARGLPAVFGPVLHDVEASVRRADALDPASMPEPATALVKVAADAGQVAGAVEVSLRDGHVSPIEAAGVATTARELRKSLATLERAAHQAARRR